MIKIKGVSEIISIVMIVAISIGLVSAAYMYGLPLLQKSQDKSALERIINFFDYHNPSSLPRKIEYVAHTGATEVLTLDAQGIWRVYPFNHNSPMNNSIVFFFFSKVTNINTPITISLIPGSTCPPQKGVVGKDIFPVVCLSGTPMGDGFNVTYIIYFRSLELPINLTHNETYSILLTTPTGGELSSTGKTLRISRQGIEKTSSFIATKVRIEIS